MVFVLDVVHCLLNTDDDGERSCQIGLLAALQQLRLSPSSFQRPGNLIIFPFLRGLCFVPFLQLEVVL